MRLITSCTYFRMTSNRKCASFGLVAFPLCAEVYYFQKLYNFQSYLAGMRVEPVPNSEHEPIGELHLKHVTTVHILISRDVQIMRE